MKRILLIAAGLSVGGAEKVTRDIGKYSRQAGFAVDYLVFGSKIGEYESELQETGCRIFHLPSPATDYRRYFRTLKRIIKENHYHVVHAHTMFNCGWAMLAARQEGVPIRIAHAHSALKDGHSIKKKIYEMVMRRLILDCATDLIACGEAAGVRLFGKRTYERLGTCVLNGIDVDQFAFREQTREKMREELHLRDKFVIGHVGHLSAVKNQAFLIRQLPRIIEKRPNAVLLLLGEGEDRPMLQKLIRDQDLENRVIMTGNVSNVQDYLSAMDVFAFPSLFEGMPLSIVEVQANGLPCILSTGVPKDVYLTDLLTPISLDDDTAWIDALCSTVRHTPEKYAAVLKSKKMDTASVMQKYLEIYERAEVR